MLHSASQLRQGVSMGLLTVCMLGAFLLAIGVLIGRMESEQSGEFFAMLAVWALIALAVLTVLRLVF